jgi:hypothetical protein
MLLLLNTTSAAPFIGFGRKPPRERETDFCYPPISVSVDIEQNEIPKPSSPQSDDDDPALGFQSKRLLHLISRLAIEPCPRK